MPLCIFYHFFDIRPFGNGVWGPPFKEVDECVATSRNYAIRVDADARTHWAKWRDSRLLRVCTAYECDSIEIHLMLLLYRLLASDNPHCATAARWSPNDQAPSSSTPTIDETPGSSIVTP